MPTFHFMKQGVKVAEVQGADSNALGSKIEQYQVKVKAWGSGQRLGGAPSPSAVLPNSNPNTNRNSTVPVHDDDDDYVMGDSEQVYPLEQFLVELMDMGFPVGQAQKALIETNNAGLDQAVEWLVTNDYINHYDFS